jgi:cell division protein YceG involved in septum cleavage
MHRCRALGVTVVLLALVAGGAWRAARQWYAAPGPLPAVTTVMIAPETGVHGIAQGLADAGVLRQPLLYLAMVLAEQPRAVLQAVVDAAWHTHKPDVPLCTPQEALTLASIVEKKTGSPEERGRVAAVLLNRLRRGMKLQADATTLYVIARARGERKQVLSRADLAIVVAV